MLFSPFFFCYFEEYEPKYQVFLSAFDMWCILMVLTHYVLGLQRHSGTKSYPKRFQLFVSLCCSPHCQHWATWNRLDTQIKLFLTLYTAFGSKIFFNLFKGMANPLIKAMTAAGCLRPKYPFLSAQKSVLIYVGLYLKGTLDVAGAIIHCKDNSFF